MSNQDETNADSKTPVTLSDNALKPREKDIQNVKSFLLKPSEKSSISLYEFLVLVIRKLYEEKDNEKTIDIEDICRRVKRDIYRHKPSILKKVHEVSQETHLAQMEANMFEQESKILPIDDETDELTKLPNLLHTFFYFEQANVGLNREEIIRLWLSMKKLLDKENIDNFRFWGKIMGIQKNYYIIEADMTENDSYEDEIDKAQKLLITEENNQKELEKVAEEEEEEIPDDPPKSDWKPPPAVPFEEDGVGVNKKVYFVCNVLGEEWIRLPKVTPEQIFSSRLIKKYFTGNLDAEIVSYPPYPGLERNYLRAIIARISASTQVSPIGFYTFSEEEEEAKEEEDGNRSKFVEDTEWEPIPIKELLDPEFSSWVHHGQYILPQGRTTWWNPASKQNDEAEEEEEDEDKEEMDEPEPETGPQPLMPLKEDEEINGKPAWSTKLSSYLAPQYAVAMISSNRWPGAHAFATGRTFDNIYIGWGVKYSETNFNPLTLAEVMIEFPSGAEITEIADPTPDEEAAFRARQVQAAEEAEDAEEEEEEGGEEEEEEEDD